MVTVTLLLVVLSAAGAVGTIRALRVDGYRRVPTDPRRIPRP